jgi:hypothetical protein
MDLERLQNPFDGFVPSNPITNQISPFVLVVEENELKSQRFGMNINSTQMKPIQSSFYDQLQTPTTSRHRRRGDLICIESSRALGTKYCKIMVTRNSRASTTTSLVYWDDDWGDTIVLTIFDKKKDLIKRARATDPNSTHYIIYESPIKHADQEKLHEKKRSTICEIIPTSSQSGWDKLPLDCFFHITSYLLLSDLANLAQCSKSIQKMVYHENVWKNQCKK